MFVFFTRDANGLNGTKMNCFERIILKIDYPLTDRKTNVDHPKSNRFRVLNASDNQIYNGGNIEIFENLSDHIENPHTRYEFFKYLTSTRLVTRPPGMQLPLWSLLFER
jgi:hypothetical protein